VRQDLESGLLNQAGETMNESRSMGTTARAIVTELRQGHLAQNFWVPPRPRDRRATRLEDPTVTLVRTGSLADLLPKSVPQLDRGVLSVGGAGEYDLLAGDGIGAAEDSHLERAAALADAGEVNVLAPPGCHDGSVPAHVDR
jgi:hypothetical protein